ncbi:MAG: VIT family protein [Nannocystis sp.]|nr:VIT family protein [Nannocystis sp.]MBA3549548.1 VIT family protein [Nannocystis sp.]
MAHNEEHRSGVGGWLRAAVLGANDGIVSIASLVLGVAAAEGVAGAVVTAGVAGLVGGALSMAAGEYVSVSSQRDVQRSDLGRERLELIASPEAERRELIDMYTAKGLTPELAEQVADALVAGDEPLRVHAREELNLDPDALARPVQAAVVSALSFAIGAALPLAVIVLAPTSVRVPATLIVGLVTLALLGAGSARLGRAPVARAVGRVVVGGALAMGLTYALGAVFGAMS